MKLRSLPLSIMLAGASLLLAACNKSDSPGGGGAVESVGADGVRIIHLTGDDKLMYNLKEITAAPGEKLNIELTNTGTMPRQAMAHNWILLNKPMSEGDVNALAMAASTKPPEFMPDDLSAIHAHTHRSASPPQLAEVVELLPVFADLPCTAPALSLTPPAEPGTILLEPTIDKLPAARDPECRERSHHGAKDRRSSWPKIK